MCSEEKIAKPWELFNSWMTTKESNKWMNILFKQLSWYRPIVKVFGNEYFVPRMSYFLGRTGLTYRYSGTTHYGDGWPDWFIPLLSKVQEKSKVKFNGCLLNYYRNGNDRMGWHCDDEPELDKTKSIASLSLGSGRDFCLKHKKLKLKEKLFLDNGDLLIMHPECQTYWLHSLPIRKKILSGRINLTFRNYK